MQRFRSCFPCVKSVESLIPLTPVARSHTKYHIKQLLEIEKQGTPQLRLRSKERRNTNEKCVESPKDATFTSKTSPCSNKSRSKERRSANEKGVESPKNDATSAKKTSPRSKELSKETEHKTKSSDSPRSILSHKNSSSRSSNSPKHVTISEPTETAPIFSDVAAELTESDKQDQYDTTFFKNLVLLPKDVPQNEWFAVNIVHFFNTIVLIKTISAEFCTDASCPVMNAGKRHQYLWEDSTEPVSAPEYMKLLVNWTDFYISDHNIFPVDLNYPQNFHVITKSITRRFFHVFAHICKCHGRALINLRKSSERNGRPNISSRCSFSFEHFLCFVEEFQLLDASDVKFLRDLYEKSLKAD